MALTKRVPEIQPFEIRTSKVQGRGGYAVHPIPKGMRIGEYVGERISEAEADRRYDDATMARHHTFLFAVSSRTVIDAAVGGNDTRFINHSCTPNCEAVIEGGRVFIDALRPIPVGSELFYDYAYEREPDAGQADEALYPCRCGTPACRGTILAAPPRKRGRSRATTSAAPRTSAGGASRTGARRQRRSQPVSGQPAHKNRRKSSVRRSA